MGCPMSTTVSITEGEETTCPNFFIGSWESSYALGDNDLSFDVPFTVYNSNGAFHILIDKNDEEIPVGTRVEAKCSKIKDLEIIEYGNQKEGVWLSFIYKRINNNNIILICPFSDNMPKSMITKIDGSDYFKLTDKKVIRESLSSGFYESYYEEVRLVRRK